MPFAKNVTVPAGATPMLSGPTVAVNVTTVPDATLLELLVTLVEVTAGVTIKARAAAVALAL